MIAFFLCWAPFHAQRLGYVYFIVRIIQKDPQRIRIKCFYISFQGTEFFRAINEYLMYVSGILYYVSSTINPILYNLMSLKYRQVPKL